MKSLLNRGVAVCALAAAAGSATSVLAQPRDWSWLPAGDGFWLLNNWQDTVAQVGVAVNATTPAIARIPGGVTVDANGSGLRIWNVHVAAGGTVLAPSHFQLTTDFNSGSYGVEPGLFNNGTFTVQPTGRVTVRWQNSASVAEHVNNGLIEFQSTAANSGWLEVHGKHGFNGTGAVRFSGDGGPYTNWTGSGFDQIHNRAGHRFEGHGGLGGNVPIFNAGVVDANSPGKTLTVGLAANSGTMSATNGGILALVFASQSSFIDNTGGTILANNNSSVRLLSSADVRGGTISSVGLGFVEMRENNSRLRDATITPGSELRFHNNRGQLIGTITNNGLIRTISNGPEAGPLFGGEVTFLGSGLMRFEGGYAHWTGTGFERIVNGPNHSIRGTGGLSGGALGLTNHGLISADVPGQELWTEPDVRGWINNGVMEAIAGGILRIVNNGAVGTNNGLIAARDGSRVILQDAQLSGGTFASEGTGVVEFQGAGGILTDITVEAGSLLRAYSAGGTRVAGTITNDGTLRTEGGTHGRYLIGQPMTFDGTGEVVGTADDAGFHWTGTGVERITNGVNHTIRGRGNVTGGSIRLTNYGLISADDPGQTLSVGTFGTGWTNHGEMEAKNGGTLNLFQGNGEGTNNGWIWARNGSRVLLSNVAIAGGNLDCEGTGWFEPASNNAILRDLTTGPDFLMKVPSGRAQRVRGTITNHGTILLEGPTNGGHLLFDQPMTFAGTGELVMNHAGMALHWMGTGTEQLTNGPQHTIRGLGSSTVVTIVNQGLLAPGLASPVTFGTISSGRPITNAPSGVIELKVGGNSTSDFDRVTTSSTLTCDGTLRIVLANNFQPQSGATFVLMQGNTRTGFFTSVQRPALTNNRTWGLRYTGTQVILVVGACPADIATAGSADPLSGPDGFLTGDDFDLFIQSFFNETTNNFGVLIADLTDGTGDGQPDGFLTGADFDKFIQLFFGGC